MAGNQHVHLEDRVVSQRTNWEGPLFGWGSRHAVHRHRDSHIPTIPFCLLPFISALQRVVDTDKGSTLHPHLQQWLWESVSWSASALNLAKHMQSG